MSWNSAESLEEWMDVLAAAALSLAVSFAAVHAASPLIAFLLAAIAGCGAYAALRAVKPGSPSFRLAEFTKGVIELPIYDELILTDADRLPAPLAPTETEDDVLILDDILVGLEPNSQVVRLFDPSIMPTPGQLRRRIDRHLDRTGRASAPPDDSQALYDALAELRRSLN